MDLREFLLARIAEDEAVAAEQDGAEYFTDGAWPEGLPARVLAECAAKRAIIELHDQGGMRWVGFPRADRQEKYCMEDQHASPCKTIRALASVYADHPDCPDHKGE